jgi:hypothetical protein
MRGRKGEKRAWREVCKDIRRTMARKIKSLRGRRRERTCRRRQEGLNEILQQNGDRW